MTYSDTPDWRAYIFNEEGIANWIRTKPQVIFQLKSFDYGFHGF